VIVRRERPGDEAAIRRVHLAAFRRSDAPDVDAVEAGLVDALRASRAWIPELSLVAERGGEVVGHVVCSRGTIAGEHAALGLGPLGVLPDVQHGGVGLALMHAVLGAADARDEHCVALLGDPAYYSRFGFVTSTEYDIEAPDAAWGVHFQVRTFTAHDRAMVGRFAYAPPFDDL
jgi:putative acetyltransferase